MNDHMEIPSLCSLSSGYAWNIDTILSLIVNTIGRVYVISQTSKSPRPIEDFADKENGNFLLLTSFSLIS